MNQLHYVLAACPLFTKLQFRRMIAAFVPGSRHVSSAPLMGWGVQALTEHLEQTSSHFCLFL